MRSSSGNVRIATSRLMQWAMVTFAVILVPSFLAAQGSGPRIQEFTWAGSMGGASSDDRSYSIAVDRSGNIYTTGYFWDSADFDPGQEVYNLTSTGNTDIFVSKLDDNGNFLWAKQIGGLGADAGHSIAVDRSGDVYVTGKFRGRVDFDPEPSQTYNLDSVLGTWDVFIVKLDTDGSFVWAKAFGGAAGDIATSLAVDHAGNIYTTGSFSYRVDFDPDPEAIYNLSSAEDADDIFVSKLDADGNFVWAGRMGGLESDISRSVAVDLHGNVYTTGVFCGTADFDPDPMQTYHMTSGGGGYSGDVFISKLDADGRFAWAKSIVGGWSNVASSLAVDQAGNVYTAGYFQAKADFDPDADATYYLTNDGSADAFVSKLDTDGNFLWARGMGGIHQDDVSSLAVDQAGNVYTTGTFMGTVDFDPGPGTYDIQARFRDIFVSKLDRDGYFVWAKAMGGPSDDGGSGVAVDLRGNVYTTGYFSGTADFDPGPETYDLTSVGSRDVFISKFIRAGRPKRATLNQWAERN